MMGDVFSALTAAVGAADKVEGHGRPLHSCAGVARAPALGRAARGPVKKRAPAHPESPMRGPLRRSLLPLAWPRALAMPQLWRLACIFQLISSHLPPRPTPAPGDRTDESDARAATGRRPSAAEAGWADRVQRRELGVRGYAVPGASRGMRGTLCRGHFCGRRKASRLVCCRAAAVSAQHLTQPSTHTHTHMHARAHAHIHLHMHTYLRPLPLTCLHARTRPMPKLPLRPTQVSFSYPARPRHLVLNGLNLEVNPGARPPAHNRPPLPPHPPTAHVRGASFARRPSR
jgi:hypothetical protein